jgi:hypothetical protein
LTKAEAITEAEFSGGIEKVYGANGIEVHRKACDVMAVYQVSSPIKGGPLPAEIVPKGAVKYNEFDYGWKRYSLYYEELNGESQER